jgi:hypothetical protein
MESFGFVAPVYRGLGGECKARMLSVPVDLGDDGLQLTPSVA